MADTQPRRSHPPDPRRRRSDSQQAILDATVELLERDGYRALTIEGIAQRAGVGKQTIYRWWGGSKPDLVLDAFSRAGDERVEPPDTGSVREDLLGILAPVFELQSGAGSGTARASRAMMAEAQLDADFAPRYLELHRHWWGPLLAAVARGIDRCELNPATDPQLIVDLLLGAAWYRLLLGHAPLDEAAAELVVDAVIEGVRSR